jgi:hypothetical protein
MNNLRRFLALAGTGVLGLGLLVACGGGGDGGGGGIGGTGAMRIGLTDAPACGYDEVNITIEKVRVHQNANAGDNDAGWSELLLSPARRVDLLTLQNGVVESLGELPLTAGSYTQMRLVLAENSNATPLANSVVPTGEDETALDTPSGQQSGLKIQLENTTVSAGQVLDVVLDFDACRSVVEAGNSGRYKLKPVIQAITMLTTAGQGVVGYVDPLIALPGTEVSVQQAGLPVKTTVPDLSGTAPGRVTAVMTGVPVDTVAYTEVSSMGVRIVPPAATLGTRLVEGSVAPPEATVRAWQQLTGGPKVEVRYAPVNGVSGDFAIDLPIDAPQRVAYVAAPASITFAADLPAAGLYTVEAAHAGSIQAQAIDVRAPVPPLVYSFP